MKLGAISTLLRGFEANITDAQACFFGSGVLWCLIFPDSKADYDHHFILYKIDSGDNQTIAGKLGAVELILRGIELHINDPKVCFKLYLLMVCVIMGNRKSIGFYLA